MILQRLYELAQRENLLTDRSFTRERVACRVDIGRDGRPLGLHDLREQKELPPKGKRGKPKVVLTGGKELSVPVHPLYGTKSGTPGRLVTLLLLVKKSRRCCLPTLLAASSQSSG